MNDDTDRQLTIDGCPGAQQAPARGIRLRRAAHFESVVTGARRPVHVKVDGELVTFREKGSHTPLMLDLRTWIGIGYIRAAEAHAVAAREAKRRDRSIRRLVGGRGSR